MTEECSFDTDLFTVIGAYRDKSITQDELVYVLSEGVDCDTMLEVLVGEFGIKYAKKLMMKALRLAKKQKRETRVNENFDKTD